MREKGGFMFKAAGEELEEMETERQAEKAPW